VKKNRKILGKELSVMAKLKNWQKLRSLNLKRNCTSTESKSYKYKLSKEVVTLALMSKIHRKGRKTFIIGYHRSKILMNIKNLISQSYRSK
jgi:hypothetical protein